MIYINDITEISDAVLEFDVFEACLVFFEREGIPRSLITGPKKTADLVRARMVVSLALNHLFGWSTVQIGRKLSRDHSTIVNNLQAWEDQATLDDFRCYLRLGRFLKWTESQNGMMRASRRKWLRKQKVRLDKKRWSQVFYLMDEKLDLPPGTCINTGKKGTWAVRGRNLSYTILMQDFKLTAREVASINGSKMKTVTSAKKRAEELLKDDLFASIRDAIVWTMDENDREKVSGTGGSVPPEASASPETDRDGGSEQGVEGGGGPG